MEYVKEEAKMVYLLECLQKTSPPVLIFAEKKQFVDAIHEYLLLKGVQVGSLGMRFPIRLRPFSASLPSYLYRKFHN